MTSLPTPAPRGAPGRQPGIMPWLGLCIRLGILMCMVVCMGVCLSACAPLPQGVPRVQGLLHDEFYPSATPDIDAGEIFAMTDEMRRYADTELAARAVRRDPRLALIDALYEQGRLRLSYDAALTRNAAQAFEARAGNCLSLVIMTAAFASHLGLPVSYQSVQLDDIYTRSGDLLLSNGHVNLVLGHVTPRSGHSINVADDLTVDFLPASDLRGQRTQPLKESTIVAMYMNNRAAETLAAAGRGAAGDAYRWARAALMHEPDFTPAVNTLAVIYLRDGHLSQAEAALREVLAREPASATALSNLANLLQRSGRGGEAAEVAQRLARVQPVAPFRDYDLGRQAMARGDWPQARDLFLRELKRQPDQSEVHFWAAQALWRTGDEARALQHLRMALENSITPAARGVYAAKLDHLLAAQRPGVPRAEPGPVALPVQ